jgi:hypothetical protein
VGTATLLFSPFFHSLAYNAAPFGIMTFLTAAMFALLARVWAYRSFPAALALGPCVGLAATIPHLIPVTAFIAAVGLRLAPRLPVKVAIAAILTGVAVVVPALPDTETLRAMMSSYVMRNSEWRGLEAVLLGQHSLFDVARLYDGGRARPFDVPIGAVLAPFAIPRTPLRLWADSLLDPFGAGLAAAAISICAWRWRRDRRGRLALIALAVVIVPGLVSGYDRASLHRLAAAPVVWAIMAGGACATLLGSRSMMAPMFAAVVAASGTILFDHVAPRVLPSSWLSIAVAASADPAMAGRNIFLEHGKPEPQEWLHVRTIARYLPARPVEVRAYTGPDDLDAGEGEPPTFYWSPALERDESVQGALCARRPDIRLYSLWDRAGLSAAMAARTGEPSGFTHLPDRWSAAHCGRPNDSGVGRSLRP